MIQKYEVRSNRKYMDYNTNKIEIWVKHMNIICMILHVVDKIDLEIF